MDGVGSSVRHTCLQLHAASGHAISKGPVSIRLCFHVLPIETGATEVTIALAAGGWGPPVTQHESERFPSL